MDYFEELLEKAEIGAAEGEEECVFHRVRRQNKEIRRRASLHPNDPDFLECEDD